MNQSGMPQMSTPTAKRAGAPRGAQQKGSLDNLFKLLLFYPILIFYMELVTRFATYGDLMPKQLLYILLFSLSGGALWGGIVSLIRNKLAVRIVSIALSGGLAILYSAHVVYYKIFGNYFDWENLGMAGEAATQFSDMLWSGIGKSLFAILLMALPVIGMGLFIKRLTFYPSKRVPLMIPMLLATVMMLTFLLSSFLLTADKSEGTDYEFYTHPNDLETPKTFGILTSTRLNFGRILFGIGEGVDLNQGDDPPNGPIVNPFETTPGHEQTEPPVTGGDGTDTESGSDSGSETKPPDPPKEYGYNTLDIDFDSLIAGEKDSDIRAMHTYFSKLTGTKQNAYTGYFEGKNLIFLTLEGFSGQAIIPELTPTLYQMANEGFVFQNFYNGVWGGSTSTGEYANLTGLFYNKVKCMRTYVGEKGHVMPFSLGNQFTALGYQTYAFHANSYTYYGRDMTHPHLGYTYLGIGNGLENLTSASGKSFANTFKIGSNNTVKPWPTSDQFTAEVTLPTLIESAKSGPFHAYYMTISGHAKYSFGGNAQSEAHEDEVRAYCAANNLNYSDNVMAYLACQIEVELMMQTFLRELEAAGILEDTVFVLAADHYPYDMTDAELAELYDLPVENITSNFDLYRNALIIWSSSMEAPVIVDVPCSAIDILPTVSNLFGLPYDSRLMMGIDVFSDQEPLVILNCNNGPSWNWINKYGSYRSGKGFTVNPAYEVDGDALNSYVKQMNSLLSSRKKYAFAIIENNYYSYLFGNNES